MSALSWQAIDAASKGNTDVADEYVGFGQGRCVEERAAGAAVVSLPRPDSLAR